MSVTLYQPFDFLTESQMRDILRTAVQEGIGTQQIKNEQGNIHRNSRISWYRKTHHNHEWLEIFNYIQPGIEWIETPQIAFYKPGEYYDWHTDERHNSTRSYIRKFTLVANIHSAPGSGLEIKDKPIIDLGIGQAVIFPSMDLHRAVTPEQGERASLTMWAMSKNTNKNITEFL